MGVTHLRLFRISWLFSSVGRIKLSPNRGAEEREVMETSQVLVHTRVNKEGVVACASGTGSVGVVHDAEPTGTLWRGQGR